jgi:hypothetical protein
MEYMQGKINDLITDGITKERRMKSTATRLERGMSEL